MIAGTPAPLRARLAPRLRARLARRPDEIAERERLAQLAERLAVLLGAGVAPAAAWRHLAELGGTDAERMRRAAELAAHGHPLAELITGADAAAHGPAEPGWRTLVAAWDVAVAAGAPLGDGLHALAEALRGEAELRREVATALAGPRSSARLVAWLPVVAVGFGAVLGFDTIGTLTGTPIGAASGAVGVLLLWAGAAWNRRLAARAARMPDAPGLELELVAIAMSGGASLPAARRLVRETLGRLLPDAGDGRSADEVQALAERAGAPVALLLKADAARLRRDARAAGELRAASLGTALMIPLGVCVLPAFGLLGVAPLLISVVTGTLG
ncbi:type II secretion system F family protein [Agromyces archimandritae]|uniref:Type II secretion system F family protein n=1 Tax=Agromyces archimandritae TaxID=2781962 RepID=A0A975FQL8_9MICO|nr:type II secretion system F family protein [Agromyces archimandritae]QTX05416.1 type II secretion system F family protein [Agromyces archimandritae]